MLAARGIDVSCETIRCWLLGLAEGSFGEFNLNAGVVRRLSDIWKQSEAV